MGHPIRFELTCVSVCQSSLQTITPPEVLSSCHGSLYKIIIKLPIGREIALISNLEYFKCTALIKNIFDFTGSWYNAYKHKPRGVVANVLVFDIVVREFELCGCYYFRFRTNTIGKGMKPLIPPALR